MAHTRNISLKPTQRTGSDLEMAAGPNIVLTATAISFANEWYQEPTNPNFRVLIAGVFFALFDGAVASISPTAANGLGAIMMITTLLTPFNGKSPVQTLASLSIAQPKG